MQANNPKFILENILLCDPVSKRGKDALKRLKKNTNKDLTFNDFYEKVYAPPFFVKLKNIANDFGVFNTNYEDFSFVLSGIDIETLNEKMELFETYFLEQAADDILYIRASAGSGKTIYLNYLKRERRKKYYPNFVNTVFLNDIVNDAYELNLDLEKSSDSLSFGSVKFPIDPVNSIELNSQWNFYIMILKSIFDNCFKIIKTKKFNSDILKENFNIIYGLNYTDTTKDLFDYLLNTEFSSDGERDIKETLLNKIIATCFNATDNTISNTKTSLTFLCRLLAITLSELNNPNQILISFDNIEHLIDNKKRIYDEDITQIVKTIEEFVEQERGYYEEKELNFAEFFKIVLVIRDTTDKMLYGDVQNRFVNEYHSLNIAGWFLLEEIYNNKLAYFNLDKNLSSIKFIDLITNDSLTNQINNLMGQISAMYNHNNRRTTRILTRISTIFDAIDTTTSMCKKTINYDTYLKLWNCPEKNHIKFLCRQGVLRLIYNNIKNTYYFDKLLVNINDYGTPENTYARRILTWLSNMDSHKQEQYYSYNDIIDNVLKSPSLTKYIINDDVLLDFCKVLINLDEHRFAYENELLKSKTEPGPNCWCQLIIIKNNDSLENSLTAKSLADKIKHQYLNNIKDSNTGIRLTEAGNFYAKKLCDFEYFACQYSNRNYPLIFMLDSKEIIHTVKSVYKTAIKTVNTALKFENNSFLGDYKLGYKLLYHLKNKSISNNEGFQSLAFRILNQHYEYLRAYELYISDDVLHDNLNLFKVEERQEILINVKKYKDGYKKVLDLLENATYSIGETKISGYILTYPNN